MHASEIRARGEHAHRTGVLVNALLALLKIAGGLLSGSPALTADGYHSLADLTTNAVAWLSFRIAERPADADHHYGHGKAEALAAVFVGAVLVIGGVSVVWEGFHLERPDYQGWEASLALSFAAGSMLVKLWLARVTGRTAKLMSSQVLAALTRDNRSDALTSFLVILALGGSLIHLGWAEAVVTAGIGVFIASMGVSSIRESADVLMDRMTDPELRSRVESVASSIPGVRAVDLVRIHPLGAHVHVDMEVAVDGDLSVRKGHEIAHAVERAVTQAEEHVVQVTVHVQPSGSAERDGTGL